VRDAKYRPISDLAPGVPPELEAIVDKCLTRSRAHRYQTAAEIETDLRAFLRRYVPNYSRSHLGRYMRKLFAPEIEKELRMLEEYVLSDQVSDDVGENLIGRSEEVVPDAVPFQPKPTGTAVPAPRGDFDEGSSQTTLPKGAGGFDLHAAETVIIDTSRRPTVKPPAGRMPPPPPPRPAAGVATPPQRPRARVQAPLDDYDEALHNAPTMILDGNRLGRRR